MINHGRQITSLSYYDGEVVGTVTEVEQEQFTDKQYLLRDVIDSLAVITTGATRKLVVEVSLDKQDRIKLTSKWRLQ